MTSSAMQDATWHDYTGLPLAAGSMVLDDKGLCWTLTTRGGYGRENVALCDGVGYNGGQDTAVRLGETFKIAGRADPAACPRSQKVGKMMFDRWFERLVRPGLSRELKERRWKGRRPG